MAQLMVFVSHNHSDLAFCQAIVQALRDAGADVWFDESDLSAGHVRRVIMQELVRRPIFIVVLSKAALASQWVMDECDWAYDLQKDEPSRVLLPVVVEPLERADFNAALHLYGLKRIEAPGMQPYPTEEAVRRLLHTLALTPRGESPAPTAPQPSERVDDLLRQGHRFAVQERYAEALPLYERAMQREPGSAHIWFYLADTLSNLGRYGEALVTFDRVFALNPDYIEALYTKATVCTILGRYREALEAYEHVLALEPNAWVAWSSKAEMLDALGHPAEAEQAKRRAQELGG